MRIERRGVGLVLAIVAAIALVALASRGDHAGRGARAVSLPAEIAGTIQAIAIIVLGLLALAMVALMLWSMVPSGAPKLERPARSRWRSAVGIAVAILLAVLIAQARPSDERGAKGGAGGVAGAGAGAGERGDGSSPATKPAWALGIGGVAMLTIAAGAMALHRRRGDTVVGRSSAIATPGECADAVHDAEQCADPRQAVLLAFAAAEALLSTDLSTRRPPSTSAREWFDALRIPSLGAIVGRYEIARFSQHEVTEDDRAVALTALRGLT